MQPDIANRAARLNDAVTRARYVALAMCNAERKHHMLPEVGAWYDLTDEAQEHYMRLARAALKAVGRPRLT